LTSSVYKYLSYLIANLTFVNKIFTFSGNLTDFVCTVPQNMKWKFFKLSLQGVFWT